MIDLFQVIIEFRKEHGYQSQYNSLVAINVTQERKQLKIENYAENHVNLNRLDLFSMFLKLKEEIGNTIFYDFNIPKAQFYSNSTIQVFDYLK